MKNNIAIVTGTSGAGKSTLKQHFEDKYSNDIFIYDFDDVGVPENADQQRRIDTTKYRMQTLNTHSEKGEKAILFGQVVPDEIESSKENIVFIFLEASWDNIQQRLTKRGRSQEFIQDYKGWSEHIKNSVLKNKGHIVSTDSSIQKSAKEILEVIETE